MQTKLKTEYLIFLFGALVILLNFGDDHTGRTIGNLDTIFGLHLWPLMDVLYFLGSIWVFMSYGKAKGGGELRLNAKTVLPLAAYVVALLSISVDDFSTVLFLNLKFPETYWIAVMWLYPIIAFLAFFSFGAANEKVANKSAN